MSRARLSGCLLCCLAILTGGIFSGPVAAEDNGRVFMGADMTLYFDGPADRQLLSSQVVLLVYLPAKGPGPGDYDPRHESIQRVAQRLTDDVAVVPLSQVWPTPDEKSWRWIRLMDCGMRDGVLPDTDVPLLFFSFSSFDGRACAISVNDGVQTARLLQQFLMLEESGCSFEKGFRDHMWDWASEFGDVGNRIGALSDIDSVRAAIRAGEEEHCEG